VVFSLGGSEGFFNNQDVFKHFNQVTFIIIGSQLPYSQDVNHINLQPRSTFYHPDIIQAADVVIAKAGYSTLAEASAAGTPFGFILRDRLPESSILRDYILQNNLGIQIAKQDLSSPKLIDLIEQLLLLPKIPRMSNDANVLARFILSNINHT
jgi:UDP-N-acetylglucosamine:LPS N-acetylglucosamine transferase